LKCSMQRLEEARITTMKRIFILAIALMLLAGCEAASKSSSEPTTYAENRNVTIISNGKKHVPYEQCVHAMEYDAEGNQTLGISVAFTPIEELLDIMPVVAYANDFRVVFDGDETTTYTLYDEKAEHLFPDEENNFYPYLGMREVSFPDEPGTYILEITKYYRYGDSGSIYHYLAKIIKQA